MHAYIHTYIHMYTYLYVIMCIHIYIYSLILYYIYIYICASYHNLSHKYIIIYLSLSNSSRTWTASPWVCCPTAASWPLGSRRPRPAAPGPKRWHRAFRSRRRCRWRRRKRGENAGKTMENPKKTWGKWGNTLGKWGNMWVWMGIYSWLMLAKLVHIRPIATMVYRWYSFS